MNRFLFLFLLLVLPLAACQPAAPQPQVTITSLPPTATPSLVPLTATPTAAPSPTPGLPALSLQPCRFLGGAVLAKCGTLTVREDRTSPTSRALNLHIIVVPAREEQAAPDPLFYLAGGPGGVATQKVSLVYDLFTQVNRTHDVVFVDQRGTSDEHHIDCRPPTINFSNASQAEMDAYAKQCLSELKLDLRFYTTAAYAQDMDEARSLLGYDTINLYGISYGVTSAQVYMRMYESRVRTAVLDHGSFLDLPMFNVWARSSQSALDRVFARCEKDPACSAAYPHLRGDWKAVLDRLAKGPVAIDYTPTGASEPMKVSASDLTGINTLLLNAKTAAKLPQIVHLLASTEDWTPIVKSLAEGENGGGDGKLDLLYFTTVCNEGWAGYDEQAIAREGTGSYLLEWRLIDARRTAKFCSALPKADPSVMYGAGKPAQTPVLVLSGDSDPQNPPGNMAQAASFWPNGRQVIEPGIGHFTPVPSCRWDVIAQFIDRGSVQGLDASCITNAPVEPFVVEK